MGRQDLALEHMVVQALKAHGIRHQNVLVAVSGGVDSIVLAEILRRWQRHLKLNLTVAHVHHGGSDDPAQLRYRKSTQTFVRNWAKDNGLDFITNRPVLKNCLKTEHQWRELRERHLRVWRQKKQASVVAFAHHCEDLLETRLIRLIRGAGPQGLESMRVLHDGKLRPLLGVSRAEIENYARLRALRWVEDPSNSTVDHLRNWLRREWLPLLEQQRPGASQALARSLQSLLGQNLSTELEKDLGTFVGLRRESLRSVSSQRQKQLIAQYLKSLGLKNYAQTHVEEIVKRLGTDRKTTQFELLGLSWKITQDLLWASRV